MKEPTYKPDQWIAFENESESGFGQIVGGSFENGWCYTLSGVTAHGDLTSVAESDVVYLLQNGSWLAPSHFGGRGSIYSDDVEVEEAMRDATAAELAEAEAAEEA